MDARTTRPARPETRRASAVIERPLSRERPPIRKLPAEVVDRISAGEVVENPASVVKELIENAIDAEATLVEISLDGGGIDRIEVSDDGTGIPEAELPLAVERHATSKLSADGRLDEIRTLGFRGEALAAIGSVARLRLVSRSSSDEIAHGVAVEGGAVRGAVLEGRARGTTVEVRDLFFNTPARRKFLRSPAAEQVEVVRTIERLYLARPQVGFALRVGEAEILRFPRENSLRGAITRVVGWETLGTPIEVEAPISEGGILTAVLSHPSHSTGTSQSLYLSINGRPVFSRTLQQAIRVAYTGFLPKNRYPLGCGQLTLDAQRTDVNVHPTKREVRLSHEREVAEEIRRAVREALLRASPLAELPGALPERALDRSVAPVGASDTVSQRSPETRAPAPVPTLASQRRLLPEPPGIEVLARDRRPTLELRSSLFRLYWIAESSDELVLIDQHAASERLLYEQILQDGHLARQELVSPILIRLTPLQATALAAHEATVRSSGFEVDAMGGESYWLRSVPVYRARRTRPEVLPELLNELASGGRPTVVNGVRERTSATIACHAAIRAGDEVAAEEFHRVLESLYALPEMVYACPHGRPILVKLPRSRLDRWFLRSGD